MGGGYLNSNKKNYSERRNHGLSLTNLTHCISPSEYCNDYYNNDSFNKINLQLHASSNKVSNPYSFSIKSNTGFSASVEPEIPNKDTLLISVDDTEEKDLSFIVPGGITVLRVDYWAESGYQEALTYVYNNSMKPKIEWVWDNGDEGVAGGTVYVGVTPGKSYKLYYSSQGDTYNISIFYSSEINTHAPQVKDY